MAEKRLRKNASRASRIQYIKDRLATCGQRMRESLEQAWLAGSEMLRLRYETELKGEKWNEFVEKTFGLGERQAFNIQRLAKGFKSPEDIPDDIVSISAGIRLIQSNNPPCTKNTAALPLSALVPPEHRPKFRVANRDLVEIAYNDPDLFVQVCAYIEKKTAQTRHKLVSRLRAG